MVLQSVQIRSSVDKCDWCFMIYTTLYIIKSQIECSNSVFQCSSFPLFRINVTFVDKDGEETLIKVPVGMSMLEAAHENDIELEGDLTL